MHTRPFRQARTAAILAALAALLAGWFEKIRPGAKRLVPFVLGPAAFSSYDVSKHEWVAEPGAFEMLIGRSRRDIQLRGAFELVK